MSWDEYEIKDQASGYLSLKDGETVKVRVCLPPYKYHTVKTENDKMPLKDSEASAMIEREGLENLLQNQTLEIRERFLFIVYQYGHGAKVFKCSGRVFKQLQALNKNQDWEGGLAKNDVAITREGESTDTTYQITYLPKSQEVTKDAENQILNLDVQRLVPGAKQLK